MNGITYDFFSEDESWLVDDLLDAKRRSKAFTVITKPAMSLVLFCCHASFKFNLLQAIR